MFPYSDLDCFYLIKNYLEILNIFNPNGTRFISLTRTILENDFDTIEGLTGHFQEISSLIYAASSPQDYFNAGKSLGTVYNFYKRILNPENRWNTSRSAFFDGFVEGFDGFVDGLDNFLFNSVKSQILERLYYYSETLFFNLTDFNEIYQYLTERPLGQPVELGTGEKLTVMKQSFSFFTQISEKVKI